MPIVATMTTSEEAAFFVQLIKDAQIPSEIRKVTNQEAQDPAQQDTECLAVVVPDEFYERACDVIESWAAQDADAKGRSGCPVCGSAEYELCKQLEEGESITGMSAIYRCRNCGRLIPV